MLTTLVKTIVNTNNNTFAKNVLPIPIPTLLLRSTANTNTFVTILFTLHYIQQRSFFALSSINKVNRMIVAKKMAESS